MKAGDPSRTAEFMALFRALESARPTERLFEDRFAKLFLRLPLRLVLALSQVGFLRRLVLRLIDLSGPGARSSGIARTRLIDDWLRSALAEGIEQVVIIGAGFDCRAYRIPEIERVRVLEVDHPDTLAEKQRRLTGAVPSTPSHVQCVAVDFNERRVDEAIAGSGYDRGCRTCFLWEGVTNYLTDSAIDAMFRWFSTAAAGSVVIFTYVDRRVLTEPESFRGATRLLRRFRRIGEPWTFGFDPAEVATYLARRGLNMVQDLGAIDYRARYWTGRRDGLSGYEFYHVAVARVAGCAAQPPAGIRT